MKKDTLKFTNLVFLFSALALVLISILSYTRINEQAKASNMVSNTQLLKFKLNDAFSHLIATETAQRGYLLTGNKGFLSDYLYSKQQIPKLLAEIYMLVSDSKEQHENFSRASYLFNVRLLYIQTTLDRLKVIPEQTLDSMLVKGKKITDDLNTVINRMISTEDNLLEQRMTMKEKEEQRTSFFILMFSAVSITILVYSYFKLKKETVTNNILEQKVQERTKALYAANETLNKQNLDLKRKNEELNSFTFITNHDLKEPLRKIELYTGKLLALNEPVSSEGTTLITKTIQCVARMRALLEDIFTYTMTDAVSELEIVDLNKTVAACVTNLHDIINEKQAVIEFGQLPLIKGVPHQMEQLFTNLLSNSLKYSKKNERPMIRVESGREMLTGTNAYWKITVADNGIGFKEAYQGKIFEMFQRLHLKHEYSGTGMGLAICKKIVENHRGTITAHSNNGDGAVFIIKLPETILNGVAAEREIGQQLN
jgi:signal transduction histidine kinase